MSGPVPFRSKRSGNREESRCIIASRKLVKEMGLTVEEFLRGARKLAEGAPFESSGDEFRIHLAEGDVRIHFQARPPRRLGTLQLPVTRVEIDLGDLPETQRCRFLQRFHLHFQRGGG